MRHVYKDHTLQNERDHHCIGLRSAEGSSISMRLISRLTCIAWLASLNAPNESPQTAAMRTRNRQQVWDRQLHQSNQHSIRLQPVYDFRVRTTRCVPERICEAAVLSNVSSLFRIKAARSRLALSVLVAIQTSRNRCTRLLHALGQLSWVTVELTDLPPINIDFTKNAIGSYASNAFFTRRHGLLCPVRRVV